MMEQCKEKLNIAMFGQKRIPSREGGVEIVVEELCTRMVAQGHNVTCYNRGGHHVSGSEYDSKRLKEYKGIKLVQYYVLRNRVTKAYRNIQYAKGCTGRMNAEQEKRKLQDTILIIAKEIDKICKENNIDYFMDGGTQLGAIRHKGFIPWDDDFDIGMRRAEFDRFIDVCQQSLNKNRFCLETEKDIENSILLKILLFMD